MVVDRSNWHWEIGQAQPHQFLVTPDVNDSELVSVMRADTGHFGGGWDFILRNRCCTANGGQEPDVVAKVVAWNGSGPLFFADGMSVAKVD